MPADSTVIKHNVSKQHYLSAMKFSSVLQQKKTREYTTLIFTIVALIIFSVFAINPTLTTIVQLQKQLADSKTLDEQLGEKFNTLQKLKIQYEEIAPDLPLVEAAIPVTPDAPTFLAQIQSLAKKYGLTIDSIEVEKVPYTKEGLKKGETGSFVASFRVLGAYNNMNNFISDVISFDRLVTVEQIIYTRDKQNSNLLGSADLKAYFDQQAL